MYRYAARSAFFSFIVSLLFLIAAFKGYTAWYTGFIFFLWLTLALLNYRHCTTLWTWRNKRSRFLQLWLFVFLIGISGDYFIGQRITNAWVYPHYTSLLDWLKLYLIIYPFGGLSVLELILFIGFIFKERLVLVRKASNPIHFTIDTSNFILDGIMIVGLIALPFLYVIHVTLPFQNTLIVTLLLIWMIDSTIQFLYHLRGGIHWLWLFLLSVFLFITLHEVPNTFAYEWRYLSSPTLDQTLPILNHTIQGIPYWVIMGWYLILILMYKLWTHIHSIAFREEKVLQKHRKLTRKKPR